jgi:hypothetical protein
MMHGTLNVKFTGAYVLIEVIMTTENRSREISQKMGT